MAAEGPGSSACTARRAHYVIFPIITNFNEKVNRMFSQNQGKTDGVKRKISLDFGFFQNFKKKPLVKM
jgi:hypothetical protein